MIAIAGLRGLLEGFGDPRILEDPHNFEGSHVTRPDLAPAAPIDECNERRIIVLFDANVLIRSIRGGVIAELFHRVERRLRHTTTTVVWECIQARPVESSAQEAKQRRDLDWIRANVEIIHLSTAAVEGFERAVYRRAFEPHGSLSLGDAILASTALATTRRCAIATIDQDDFDRFRVTLLTEFREHGAAESHA